MPQIFQVLRCFKCSVFQVHQTKKSNKFQCKLCGEKQSIKRHYGLGTAKDCRLHVQKLNGMRGEIDELNAEQIGTSEEEISQEVPEYSSVKQETKASKWSSYVEDAEEKEDDDNEKMCLGDAEVVLEIPQKKRKQFNKNIKKNKRVKTFNYNTKINTKNNDEEEENDIYESTSNNSVNLVPLIDNPSKLYQPHSLSEKKLTEKPVVNHNAINHHLNESQTVPKKKFVPPVVNKNSKWAQFTDDDDGQDSIDQIDDGEDVEYCIADNNKYKDTIIEHDKEKQVIIANSQAEKHRKYIPKNNTNLPKSDLLDNLKSNKYKSNNIGASQRNVLFSQCDDGDLDELLSF